jgi:hypothetical protein
MSHSFKTVRALSHRMGRYVLEDRRESVTQMLLHVCKNADRLGKRHFIWFPRNYVFWIQKKLMALLYLSIGLIGVIALVALILSILAYVEEPLTLPYMSVSSTTTGVDDGTNRIVIDNTTETRVLSFDRVLYEKSPFQTTPTTFTIPSSGGYTVSASIVATNIGANDALAILTAKVNTVSKIILSGAFIPISKATMLTGDVTYSFTKGDVIEFEVSLFLPAADTSVFFSGTNNDLLSMSVSIQKV